MKILRRLLGVLVMIAGILGLILSLAGLVMVWVLKPAVAGSVTATFQTFDSSITTSQKVMETTSQALGATITSVDALSDMLGATAKSVEDSQPVFIQLTSVMSTTLPSTFKSATDSLKTAQEAAVVLESSIKSLDSFRAVLGATPLLSAFLPPNQPPYNPEKPLADSLGELATNLTEIPATFTEMSANIDQADNNLDTIKGSLTTMSGSVSLISKSLGEYQAMIGQSQASMDTMKLTLANIQANLPAILNGVAIGFSLFFAWLLVAQVVILSQGWELYQGTAGRMEGGAVEPAHHEAAVAA